MVDSIYRTRSLGVGAEGIPDQYADGRAARLWESYVGGRKQRTDQYRRWIVDLLRSRNCQTVLDTACGTGIDSIMLVEEGFRVVSMDASDRMLKYALKERWNRRKEPEFDQWVIEEGNWMSLVDDVAKLQGQLSPSSGGQFDAVICLGNSFAHLPDFDGNLHNQRRALENFIQLVKPGGILVIDHRNYDEIIRTGQIPAKNIYYNSSHIMHIKCSTMAVNGKPNMVTMDYYMDPTSLSLEHTDSNQTSSVHHFRLSYYPHCLDEFSQLLRETADPDSKHEVFGDFKPLGVVATPAYYIHVVEKPSSKPKNESSNM